MSPRNDSFHEALAECSRATADLVRTAEELAGTLDGASGGMPADVRKDVRKIELQRVLVDEAHSRLSHAIALLLNRAREF